ncbi:biotin--[acetyl-CoA-carboxylase] ligase [Aureimonas sp. SA4125]|uniref:biotin--[acetyl-CoA-carboxylase] ligase n=1 Tax=Aureimonas sp. SA4125 TaxID=2826993 RepID=UPI001CC5ABBE|nr:biotin--[acetyl-CoA-carboxylase] ligase [Aureimonas sp. SA4125]BDA84460.1 biotin--[acetyl-CoA-carboxylase] ligase [Aureimonas sp. SA4125]
MSRLPRRHLALDEVGSTNVVALDAARAGDPGSLWVTAERQSAGRGRRARPWVSERGNLYASLLLIDPAGMVDLQNLPLVAAVGVRNGLATLEGAARRDIRIKWPNDILVNGRKCVGILLESERLSDGRFAIVIGCGVNVENVPDDTPYPVTGLRREGVTASVSDVFAALATGVEQALALWQRGRNFSAVRQTWIDHAAGIGMPCTVRMNNAVIEGTFVDLDDTGRLILADDSGGRRSISAGDLFLLGSSGDAP